MALSDAVQGARHTPQVITWEGQNLTGASLTATKRNVDTGAVTTVDGVFAITDAANGVFTWAYGVGDVGTSGHYGVQIRAAYALFDATIELGWVVHPLQSATTVAAGALVLVPADDAAWAAAGRAAVPDANDLVEQDDLGTAAAADTTDFDAAGTGAAAAALRVAKAGDTMTGNLTFAQPSATDFTLMTIDAADTDALPFYWKLWTSAQAGRDNVGWNLGYNQAAAGGPQAATDAAFYLQFESHYNPAADPLFEYHLNAFAANGLSSIRPFQINVYKDDLNTEEFHTFDKLTWSGRVGSPQLMLVTAGATAALSQWIMFMPPTIRVDGATALSVKNAANDNRVLMGENGTANGGYIKIAGTAPTIDGDTGKYLGIQNFAGITFPGSLGTMYGSGVWDVAPTIDLAAGKIYKINAVQVVGARVIDARCDDTINSGDATTDGVIDSLRDAMIAHGLIAAA